MTEPVYKILSVTAYQRAAREGRFTGSADDLRDGFIHLSAGHQVEGTLAAHFAGQEGLMLVALDAAQLGPALKWERSRGGALFPHLHAPLDLAAVLWAERLALAPDGCHILPKGINA